MFRTLWKMGNKDMHLLTIFHVENLVVYKWNL